MDNRWNEMYPRPQLVREDWKGLNGEWRFRTRRTSETDPAEPEWETINVPFCPESRLSGICRRIAPGEIMIYEREFDVPDSWADRRVILHFGAADQKAAVFIDGKEAGSHEGGYLPFSFDVTDLLKHQIIEQGDEDGAAEPGPDETADADSDNTADAGSVWAEESEDSICGTHTLRVEVIDDLDHRYPWGKQKRNNGGMWYTPVSGIWQSVWMEPVAAEGHITSLKIDCGTDWVEIRAYGIEEGMITLSGSRYHMISEGTDDEKCASIHIDVRRPHLWSPEDPYLYGFTIETESGDRIRSYFALRTLTIEERDGYKRLCLNGEPYFFNGLLDQGYWQDGIYTPESPEKIAGDILAMKSLGFNMLRKHIKIEHEQFYYDCDRLGMAVFQDMVNNADYSFIHDTALPTIGIRNLSDIKSHRGVSRKVFLESMEGTVRHLYSHPSVCYWTIFNEGWGQFCADEAYDRLRSLDSSRFIDSTSGWFWQSKSDVDSYHVYFKPVNITAGERPLVLSEFGGYACKLPDHCFNREKTYGYRKCEDESALLRDIVKLYTNEILPLIDKGLCAAVYTQLSDVEDETNGILTYDREILKFRSYTGTGGTELMGRFTEQQGGRVIAAPSGERVRAYVAENHTDTIRIYAADGEMSGISITDRTDYEKGTMTALVTGILEGFIDLFGPFSGSGSGFDAYISTGAEPAETGPSAAYTMLLCRIINDRYFGGSADAVQLARISAFAETEYYGRQCDVSERLAIGIGKLIMIDFSGKEPDIELLDTDAIAGKGLSDIISGYGGKEGTGDGAAVVEGMKATAGALGVSRLCDLNDEQFRRKRADLEKKVGSGELTQQQVECARYFYEVTERTLAASIALKAGKTDRFLQLMK